MKTPRTGQLVALSSLSVGPARLRRQLAPGRLEELCASIVQYGILEPLLVRQTEVGFELICGHRRYEAAKRLRLPEVPVVFRDTPDEDLTLVALQENLHRDGMNPVDEARAYREILDAGRARNRTELARLVGVTPGRVSQILAVLELSPEVQDLFFTPVKDGGSVLNEKHARILRRIVEVDQQIDFARMASQRRLSPEKLESVLRGETGGLPRPPEVAPTAPDSPWTELESSRYRRTRRGLEIQLDGRTHAELVRRMGDLLRVFREEE